MQEGLYELTVRNADKGSLALADVQKRLRQFKEQGLAVVLTQVSPILQSGTLKSRVGQHVLHRMHPTSWPGIIEEAGTASGSHMGALLIHYWQMTGWFQGTAPVPPNLIACCGHFVSKSRGLA